MATRKSFNADLFYGASDTGKTYNLGKAAEYYYSKTGKKVRLVTTDGGGYGPIDYLEAAGVMEVWALNDRDSVIEALDQACKGWWPLDPTDRSSKIQPSDLSKVCLYLFEGLTSMGDLIMGRLRGTKARLSQDPSYIISDGGTSYAGGNMSYYGFVQDRLYDMVMKTHMLPVDRVIWTALEGKGEEEGTRIPIFGPAIAGRKSIGKAPQWFGNCLHLEQSVMDVVADAKTKQASVTTKRLMYLKSHADPTTKIVFPAKARVPVPVASLTAAEGGMPEYLDPPDAAKFYELLDKMQGMALSELEKKLAKATASVKV